MTCCALCIRMRKQEIQHHEVFLHHIENLSLPIPVPDGPDGPDGPLGGSFSSTEFSSSKRDSKGKLSLFGTLRLLLFGCSGAATCNPNPGLSVTC